MSIQRDAASCQEAHDECVECLRNIVNAARDISIGVESAAYARIRQRVNEIERDIWTLHEESKLVRIAEANE